MVAQPVDVSKESCRPSAAEVRALIEAAVAAPSADNRHHLRFEVGDEALVLRTDDFYASCEEPHRRYLTELSYGAIAENLRIALAARGRLFHPRWFPDPADPRVLLRLVWNDMADAASPDPLADHIVGRHTNRAFFRGPVLTPSERQRIDACFSDRDEVRLDWCDDPRRRSALLRLVRRAESERFRHWSHHAELFDSIAFEAGWSSPVAERLAPGALAIEPPLRPVFRLLRHWPLMRAVNRVGAATVLGLRAGDLPARLAPHVVAIVSRLPPRDAALQGGALFQRAWLAAESLGLALQPLAASAVLRHDPTMAHLDLTSTWHALVGDGWFPVMVFRLGRAGKPGVRSMRNPVTAHADGLDSSATGQWPAP